MWRRLGTIRPQLTWSLLDTPTLSETFRLSYSGIDTNLSSYAYLRQYFSNDEVLPSSKLFPKREKLILELPIPQAFKDEGVIIRYLGIIRIPRKKYGFIYPDSDWQLTIEEWI